MDYRKLGRIGLAALAVGFGLLGCGGGGGAGGGSGGTVAFAYVGSRSGGGGINVFSVGADGVLTDLGLPASTADDVGGIAVSRSGAYLYAADFQGSISQFRVNPNGSLTALTPATVNLPSGNSGIAVTPNGKYLYATSEENKVYQYLIGVDGKLTPNGTPSVDTGDDPVHITINPLGQFAYVSNSDDNTISCYIINAAGVLIPNGTVNTGGGPWTTTIDRGGDYLYVGCASASVVAEFKIQNDGTLTNIGPGSVPGPATCYGVAASPSLDIVIAGSYTGTNELARYTFNPIGSLTEIGPRVATTSTNQWPLTFSSDNVLYVMNQNDNSVSVYTVDGAGALTLRDTELGGPMNEPASIGFVRR
jgi:6-phosphogluconolactonase (cycloisomerase 2 family)